MERRTPGRGRNRSDVGESLDLTIDEEARWSPQLEPERPVLKSSEGSRSRPASAGPAPPERSMQRRVSFRSEDIIRQREGLCTAVSEEGPKGLFYKRHRGNAGSAERLFNFVYAKVLTDLSVTPLLQEPDIDKLRLHQSKFVNFVFGGDGQIPQAAGADLCGLHRRMLQESGISEDAWNTFVQHFEKEANALKDAPEEHKIVALSAIHTARQHFAAG